MVAMWNIGEKSYFWEARKEKNQEQISSKHIFFIYIMD